MEDLAQAQSAFQFTNLTNRHPTNAIEEKRTLLHRTKRVLAQRLRPDPAAENKNANLSVSENQCPSSLKTALPVFCAKNLKAANPPPSVTRSLRKVNIDFFRNKKVIFKHSNVRISFEIVDSLAN